MKLEQILFGGCLLFILSLTGLGAWNRYHEIKSGDWEAVIFDGNEVYRGPEVCIDVQQVGAQQVVDIGIGPLCFFPGGGHYDSENVLVIPVAK